MTEQEIVNYLKENKNKGIAYLFMFEDVKDWIQKHRNDNKLMILTEDGDFIDGGIKPCYGIIATDVFALPDDYEVKQESKGVWIEFEIDDKGDFAFYLSKIRKKDFHWYEWQRFLFECYENNHQCFTAFGGWQYKNCKAWYTYPMILLGDDRYASSVFKEEASDAKPAIPVKIRFWREIK